MRFSKPKFADSPHVEYGKGDGEPMWVVRDDAPEEERRDLQKQINEWEKMVAEAHRALDEMFS